jgi:hypothetical protein
VLRIFFLSFVLLLLAPHNVYAQRSMGELNIEKDESETAKYEAMILKDYDYTDYDFAIMIQYKNNCESNGTAQRYDCECLAVHYLNKKIVYDEEKSDYQIFQESAAKCVDTTSVAGGIYTECTSMGLIDPKWSESFCECYANAYAEEFKKNGGNLSRRNTINARAGAMTTCNFNGILQRQVRESQEERKRRSMDLSGQARRSLE